MLNVELCESDRCPDHPSDLDPSLETPVRVKDEAPKFTVTCRKN
jgi:hypothetical protein